MTYAEILLLAVVQGVAEFLPISSSGHLRLAGAFLGWKEAHTLVDVSLHAGTLAAVLLFFRADIAQIFQGLGDSLRLARRGRIRDAIWDVPGTRMLVMVGLATIPTGVIGVLLGKDMEALASSLRFLAVTFMVNGLILLASRFLFIPSGARLHKGPRGIRWIDALGIGLAQGLGIFRGISRSGITISAGCFLGVERETAARFSFLLSIPAILGALVLELKDGLPGDSIPAGVLAVGVLTSVVVGLISLTFLMKLVRSGRFHLFGWYTLLLGAALMAWELGLIGR